MIAFLAICIAGFVVTDENQKHLLLIMMIAPILSFVIFFIERRKAYSWVYIVEQGVINKCFASKDYFIAWDECFRSPSDKLPNYKSHHN